MPWPPLTKDHPIYTSHSSSRTSKQYVRSHVFPPAAAHRRTMFFQTSSWLRCSVMLILAASLFLNSILLYWLVEEEQAFHPDNSISSLKAKPIHAASSSTSVHQLPSWIKDYAAWHQDCRSQLASNATASSWKNYRYLVIRCLHQDRICGGLADRLRALPFFLQVAAMSQRILLIHWERPAPLQLFLEPTTAINWTIPSPWMEQEMRSLWKSEAQLTTVSSLEQVLQDSANQTILDVNIRAYSQAQAFYDQHKVALDDPSMAQVFSAVWKLCFAQPTPPIQTAVQEFFDTIAPPQRYTAAHVRLLYSHRPTLTEMQDRVHNAIHCARQQQAFPVFVAADATPARQMSIAYGQETGVPVVAWSPGSDARHLDRGSDFLAQQANNTRRQEESHSEQSEDIAAYYSIFIDLYLLANARCVSFDRGGFGKLATLISGTRCVWKHYVRTCSLR